MRVLRGRDAMMPHWNVQWSHCDFCLNTGNGIIISAGENIGISSNGDHKRRIFFENIANNE